MKLLVIVISIILIYLNFCTNDVSAVHRKSNKRSSKVGTTFADKRQGGSNRRLVQSKPIKRSQRSLIEQLDYFIDTVLKYKYHVITKIMKTIIEGLKAGYQAFYRFLIKVHNYIVTKLCTECSKLVILSASKKKELLYQNEKSSWDEIWNEVPKSKTSTSTEPPQDKGSSFLFWGGSKTTTTAPPKNVPNDYGDNKPPPDTSSDDGFLFWGSKSSTEPPPKEEAQFLFWGGGASTDNPTNHPTDEPPTTQPPVDDSNKDIPPSDEPPKTEPPKDVAPHVPKYDDSWLYD